MSRWLAAALAAVSLLWAIAIVLAPYGLADGSVAAWLVYEAAGGICHQRPDRSFHLAGVPMPVCARCSGLYFSGAAGALGAWLLTPRAPDPGSGLRHARAVLGVSALPTVVTFGTEWLGLAAFSPAVRALAALPLGVAAGWLFVRALRGEVPASSAGPLDAL
jgi:uncharacterized membrane protein